MSTTKNPALRNAIERHARVCQHSKVARHILDADCCHEDNAFALFSLPRKLPGLFTVRFTAPADFTEGDIVTLKGREFRVKTRTMDEPAGKLFSAGAVVLCEIDMERRLAFITPGGESQGGGVYLGSALPEMNGTASAGSSTSVSREDHVHPSDTSRLAISGGTMTGAIGWEGSSAKIEGGSLTGEWTTSTPTSSSPAIAIATKEYVDGKSKEGGIPDWGTPKILAQAPHSFFPTAIQVNNTYTLGTHFIAEEDGYIHVYGYTSSFTAPSTLQTLFKVNDVLLFARDISGSRSVVISEGIPVRAGDSVQIGVYHRNSTTLEITWSASNSKLSFFSFS